MSGCLSATSLGHSMASSVDDSAFRELVAELRAIGSIDSATAIEDVMSSGWTSSSEYIGELGKAVLSYKRPGASMPGSVVPLVMACMREVRKVWPDIDKWT